MDLFEAIGNATGESITDLKDLSTEFAASTEALCEEGMEPVCRLLDPV